MKKPPRTTLSLGTETSEGFVRHKTMHIVGQAFDAPVLLQVYEDDDYGKTLVTTNVNGEIHPIPKRINSRLAYALPGGNVCLQD